MQKIIQPDIAEVFSREGLIIKNRKITCVFHDGDRVASLTIYPATNNYHCFGCGAHGDSIGFIMRYKNLTFGRALAYLGIKGRFRQTKHEQIKSAANKYYRDWEKQYYTELCRSYHAIQDHKRKVTSIEEINEQMYHNESIIIHHLDILEDYDYRTNHQTKLALFKERKLGERK